MDYIDARKKKKLLKCDAFNVSAVVIGLSH